MRTLFRSCNMSDDSKLSLPILKRLFKVFAICTKSSPGLALFQHWNILSGTERVCSVYLVPGRRFLDSDISRCVAVGLWRSNDSVLLLMPLELWTPEDFRNTSYLVESSDGNTDGLSGSIHLVG